MLYLGKKTLLKKIIRLICLLSCLFVKPLFSQVHDFFDKPPRWVNPLEIPKKSWSVGETQSLQHVLLYDTQICVDSDEKFYKLAKLISNHRNIHEDSQIEITFNPSFEDLKIHEIFIFRKGNKIDKRHSSAINVYQREVELESNILNGYQSAVILIDDIRIGDILVYSYTIAGTHPAYNHHLFGEHYYDFDTPVERNHLRILSSKKPNLFFKCYGEKDLLSFIKTYPNRSEWVIDIWDRDLQNKSSYKEEEPVFLEYCDFNDWGEISSLFSSYYLFSNSQDELKKLESAVKDITAGCNSKKSKAMRLLQFVQRDIRYFGTELGLNAFYPAKPHQTLEKRYGDCKDKTSLLRELLKLENIKSTPVLVSSFLNEEILKRLPSPSHFDHVILRIDLDNESFFVDPTESLQGGSLETLVPPSYTYGLPLTKENSHLVAIPKEAPNESFINIETSYSFDNEGNLLIKKINSTFQVYLEKSLIQVGSIKRILKKTLSNLLNPIQ
jgi:transglutaminase-like putative cysteine protease